MIQMTSPDWICCIHPLHFSSRFCVATTFYGISFNITGFGLNIYLTQFTYALIEVPAKVSVYFLLDKIGRRSTEVGALLFAAVSLGINIVVPKGMQLLTEITVILHGNIKNSSIFIIRQKEVTPQLLMSCFQTCLLSELW